MSIAAQSATTPNQNAANNERQQQQHCGDNSTNQCTIGIAVSRIATLTIRFKQTCRC